MFKKHKYPHFYYIPVNPHFYYMPVNPYFYYIPKNTHSCLVRFRELLTSTYILVMLAMLKPNMKVHASIQIEREL